MLNKIKDIIKWIIPSFEEKDGRASGKSLSAFALVLLFVFLSIKIVFTINDFNQNQTKLLEIILDSIVWIVIGLYAVRTAGKTKYFSGSEETKKQETKDEPIQ